MADAEISAFLQQTVGVTRNVGLATQTAPPMDVRDFGALLYQAAFGGAVGACLLRSLDRAREAGVGLRIRLRIDDRLPELADLPWEYLYASELQRFLVLSDDTPLVRYLEVPQSAPLQPVPPPLVVLAVLANPRGVQPLAVEREWAHLQEAVTGLGESQVRLERVVATWPALQGRLRQGPVHAVHFVGHGSFDGDTNQGGLLFEDEQGQAVRLAAERFKVLLHDQETVRLVFLNACEGARGGRSDSFAGVAQQLVQQAVPAVVAMQFPVTDRAAIALSREFYCALAGGYPLVAALSEARKALFGLGDGLEWGTPVLFSRSDDNRLIELAQGDHRAVIDRQAFEPESVYIPGGPCWLGSDDPAAPDCDRPLHRVDLPAYRIGRYPVTMRQYAFFVRERRDLPAPSDWFNRQPPESLLDHPIVDVSWRDAMAYCVWLSQNTGRRYTLPSEAEWEKACSHDFSRVPRLGTTDVVTSNRYPWGQEWRDGRCNVASSGTTAVTAHPAGTSAYGVEDLLGNVQEWTRSLWGSQASQPDFAYPYDPADGRELFMTFAFGMHDIFKNVYTNSPAQLRFALMEQTTRPMKAGPEKDAEEQKIRDLRNMVKNVFAVGAFIGTNKFDGWLQERLTGLNRNVRFIHNKFMLLDPLTDDPIVVAGSANFSDASTQKNDENMIIVRGDTRVADVYLGEFMRLYSHHAFRESLQRRASDDLPKPLRVDDWWKDYLGNTARSRRRKYFARSM